MKIDVLTIFPEIFPGPLGAGVVGRALERGLLQVRAVDLREHAPGRHRQVDDIPFGGGAGMVLKPEPLVHAVREARAQDPGVRCILMSPQGRRFTQEVAVELAGEDHLLLVCGRYQGVDERAREEIGEELSAGDFVISGGELAAMLVVEAVARLLPGVVGSPASLLGETFSELGFEPPLYTRPADFEGRSVPEVLLSGNHAAIESWRHKQSEELRRRGQSATQRPGAAQSHPSANPSRDAGEFAGALPHAQEETLR
jgi:tRNA (guanine37-N1)-methyltransferase